MHYIFILDGLKLYTICKNYKPKKRKIYGISNLQPPEKISPPQTKLIATPMATVKFRSKRQQNYFSKFIFNKISCLYTL